MIDYIVPNLPPESFNEDINWNQYTSSLLIETMRDKNVFTSSSVLIRRNVLLTAAHSVIGIDKGYVHLASTYSNQNIRIPFKKVIIHNGYNKENSNFKDDLALIILENNLPKSFKPAKLANTVLTNNSVDRIGFGGRNGINSRTWTNPKIKNIVDRTLVLEDTCSVIGDSGGPLFTKNGVIGIHSTLEGNSKTFAVFLPAYHKWIEENLPLKKI